jgi:hypothetical protein
MVVISDDAPAGASGPGAGCRPRAVGIFDDLIAGSDRLDEINK